MPNIPTSLSHIDAKLNEEELTTRFDLIFPTAANGFKLKKEENKEIFKQSILAMAQNYLAALYHDNVSDAEWQRLKTIVEQAESKEALEQQLPAWYNALAMAKAGTGKHIALHAAHASMQNQAKAGKLAANAWASDHDINYFLKDIKKPGFTILSAQSLTEQQSRESLQSAFETAQKNKDTVFIPLNLKDSHWCVAKVTQKQITFWDPLPRVDASVDKQLKPLLAPDFKLTFENGQQKDGHNCGIYICDYICQQMRIDNSLTKAVGIEEKRQAFVDVLLDKAQQPASNQAIVEQVEAMKPQDQQAFDAIFAKQLQALYDQHTHVSEVKDKLLIEQARQAAFRLFQPNTKDAESPVSKPKSSK